MQIREKMPDTVSQPPPPPLPAPIPTTSSEPESMLELLFENNLFDHFDARPPVTLQVTGNHFEIGFIA